MGDIWRASDDFGIKVATDAGNTHTILGCPMDSLSMILLVIPFFWPVLVDLNGGLSMGAEGSGFGMSTEDLKIWFGILALIVVELGLITPPVGPHHRSACARSRTS